MDLGSAQIRIRPRNPWEGIDLGFAMARRWFVPLWLLWWAGVLPLYLLLQLVPFGDQRWLLITLIWWGKPLYEPPLLYWLSRAAFDEHLPLKTVLRDWPRIVRPRLLMNLTLARLGAARSFRMPVALLEGLAGRARQRRLQSLERRQSAATWLTLVGVHFEMALQLSLFALLMLMIPEELRWFDADALIFSLDPTIGQIQELLSILAMSIVAPFYVAGGFSLYLTRRTELEAWDIELEFRRIADRLHRDRSPPSRGTQGAALLLCLLGGFLLAPTPTQAQPSEATPEQVRQLIREVLAADEFGHHEQVGYWKYIGGDKEKDGAESNSFLQQLARMLGEFFNLLAEAGEILLWLAAGVLAGYLIHWIARNRHWLKGLGARPSGPSAPPVQIFGLDIRPESLPEDVADAALKLFHAGNPRGALSLLYRGALARFVHRDQLPIRTGATEGECLRLVEQARPGAESALFAGLTRLWLRLAYGHESPDPRQVEGICSRWREVFTDHEPH